MNGRKINDQIVDTRAKYNNNNLILNHYYGI